MSQTTDQDVTCLPDDQWPVRKSAAIYSAVIVFGLGLFDFVDRQVLAAVMPYIKAEWNLTDTQLGTLVAVVNISIAVLVVPSAYLVDNWSRKKMLAIMGGFWSLATGACALAGGYWHLLIARTAIGAGEAGYNPAAVALLSTQFPKNLRATAIAISQIGVLLGVPLGTALGGYIAATWGWRHAFGIVMVPGLILAVLALWIQDYKTPAKPKQSAASPKQSYFAMLWGMIKTPSLFCVLIGALTTNMFNGAVMNWLPSYFSREGNMAVAQAGGIAALVLAGALASSVVAGPLIDWARRRRLNGASVLLACTLLAGVVLFIVAFRFMPAGSTIQIATLFFGFTCTGMAVIGGPVTAVDLVPATSRGSVSSLLVFFQNVFGFALGPVVTGILSDHFDIGTAFQLITLAPFIAGIAYIVCSFTFKKDVANVTCEDLSF